MRTLDRIVLHCSATEEGHPFGAADIRRWHTSPPRNWSDIGYHYVILLDGTVEYGRPVDQVGAHVKGHNSTTVGVCYIGGLRNGEPVDTMTAEQEVAFLELVYSLRKSLGYMTVHGHNEYSAKACPSFVVKEKYPFLNSGHEEQT